MILQVATNGTGDFVKNILTKLPVGVTILDSNKGLRGCQHSAFNIAPLDTLIYKLSDFSNGCYILKYCGMGLTRYGYYCCAIAGGIDRIFGFDMGKKTLPLKNDSMIEQLNKFCRLCGHFKVDVRDRRIIFSSSWDRAYKEYKERKPRLSLY